MTDEHETSTAEFAFGDALLALRELDPEVEERVRERWPDVDAPP